MNIIPIVFAFDKYYALPASIAIKSLLESKDDTTEYKVIVFHNGLNKKIIEQMNNIADIKWIKVDKKCMQNVSIGKASFETYYRLLLSELLPEYDKVIWSDVDVLFKGDLTSIYKDNIDEYDWAGIIAERQEEKSGIHTHFTENNKPFIYMPGFMVANTKLWREKNMLNRFLNTIRQYGKQLKMFDLDVLNLASDKIKAIPFEYCVLENIYDNDEIQKAPEYPWLSNVYSDNILENAKRNPIIIHYAGAPIKIWKRSFELMPKYYQDYVKQSPFYDEKYYFPNMSRKIKVLLFTILQKLCFIKKYRKKLKRIKDDLICKK